MSKKLFFLVFTLLVFFLVSCTKSPISPSLTDSSHPKMNQRSMLSPSPAFCPEGIEINNSALPQVISTYISANFANEVIESIETFDNNGVILYGVEFKSHKEVLFDESSNIVSQGIESSESKINVDSLMPAIKDFIANNYSSTSIVSAEKINEFGYSYFLINLADESELYFTDSGVFLCVSLESTEDGGMDNDTIEDGGNDGGMDNDTIEDGGNDGGMDNDTITGGGDNENEGDDNDNGSDD